FDRAVSHDSVLTGTLLHDDPMAAVHEQAIRLLLQWHLAATGSATAQELLADWSNARAAFVWVMPRALLQYQDAGEILKAQPEKALREEVASALSDHLISRLKTAWKGGTPLADGRLPAAEDRGADRASYELLNSWTVLDTALELIRKHNGAVRDRDILDRLARNLILTEDHALMSALARHARAALDHYDSHQLAVLLSHKRLGDFKQALQRRNVRSMDSPATYGWILTQDRRNREAIGRIPSFEELFAGHALLERARKVGA
ncbi:MAG: glutamate synthase large subunit, partial [Pseudomonadota bacterium]